MEAARQQATCSRNGIGRVLAAHDARGSLHQPLARGAAGGRCGFTRDQLQRLRVAGRHRASEKRQLDQELQPQLPFVGRERLEYWAHESDGVHPPSVKRQLLGQAADGIETHRRIRCALRDAREQSPALLVAGVER